jgi:sugar fermentation stimulation protein A
MDIELLTIENPITCQIVRRINRFVVEILVEGESHRAWINNSGRLHGFLVPGRSTFCVPRDPGGRTDYRLFAIRERQLGALIDTQLQMRAFERCVEGQLLPWLSGCHAFKRNARLNQSVIDYLLECRDGEAYLEIKSAVLRQGRYAMYPDCPSRRGRKHFAELTRHSLRSGRAYIAFIAALHGIEAFRPNHLADPNLAEMLLQAQQAGVELRCVGMYYCPRSASIRLFDPDLPVSLSCVAESAAPKLETERLRLIPLDARNLRLSLDRPQQLEQNLGVQVSHDAIDAEMRSAVQQMLAGVLEDPENWLWYTHWQITLKGKKRIVGGACFKGPADAKGEVEIGYGIDDAYRGHGYMTEALQEMVGWALAQPHVVAVVAETAKSNSASQRVLQRAGFTQDRETGKHLWWRIQKR